MLSILCVLLFILVIFILHIMVKKDIFDKKGRRC